MKTKTLSVIFLGCLVALLSVPCGAQQRTDPRIALGDPYILAFDSLYYLYGTHSPDGIEVYVSDDLHTWSRPESGRLALSKENSYGEGKFWAPEVYWLNGQFYMYYSAGEHICVATSDSPTGPFVQAVQQPMVERRGIDNSLFIDTDGTPYLFWVFFDHGNEIWQAELEDDLMTIKPSTMRRCIRMSQEWERVWPSVNEGPFVVRHNNTYYMTYSANSYESPCYGVGCAVADSLSGEWVKYEDNPVLQSPEGLVGVGHHSLFTDFDGVKRIVFHSHNSSDKIHPRVVHIGTYRFDGLDSQGRERLTIDKEYFTPTRK